MTTTDPEPRAQGNLLAPSPVPLSPTDRGERLTTNDMRLSLERLGASMGICVSAPVKASREWLMAEHARLTSLRTRLYGQVSR